MPFWIYRLVLLACLLGPLPFASVSPWAWGTMAMIIGVALICWAMYSMRGSTDPSMEPHKTWPLIVPFFLAIAWALVQTSTLTPDSWHHPLWREAGSALGEDLPGSIGLETDRTFDGILRLCTYAGIFWLAFRFGRDPGTAKKTVTLVAFAGTCYAVYGLMTQLFGIKRILWMAKYAYMDDLTSTFVNRNNYATYAGICWVCVMALAFDSYTQYLSGVRVRSEKIRLSIKFIEQKGWLYLLQMLILASALLYSHSRAGLASTVVGLIALFIALGLSRIGDKKLIVRFSIVGALLLVVFYVAGGRGVDQRLGNMDLVNEERPVVYALTSRAIGDQPLLGAGLGGFEDAFRLYRTPQVRSVFDYAHDTYLETALELGIPAALLIAIPIVIVMVANGFGVRRRRRDIIYPCIGLAVSTLVWVHAIVDFSVQIPAVAATYALLLGVAYAQSVSSKTASRTS